MFDERDELPVLARENWQNLLKPTFPKWGVDDLCFAMSLFQYLGKARLVRQVLQKRGLFSTDHAKVQVELDVLTMNYLIDESNWTKILGRSKILR